MVQWTSIVNKVYIYEIEYTLAIFMGMKIVEALVAGETMYFLIPSY